MQIKIHTNDELDKHRKTVEGLPPELLMAEKMTFQSVFRCVLSDLQRYELGERTADTVMAMKLANAPAIVRHGAACVLSDFCFEKRTV